MRGRLIVVAGTGTEIGKTHVACALVRRAGRTCRACGLKPIETGVLDGEEGGDGRALREASHPTFHVKHTAPYLFRRPVSPHLAARDEGRVIELEPIARFVASHPTAELLLVELAGGLFSPLGPRMTNAELASALQPDFLVLVAPDRLGVLHDVTATARAAAAMGVRIDTIALVAPAVADASTGTNARELALLSAIPIFSIPRGTIADLAAGEAIAALYAASVA